MATDYAQQARTLPAEPVSAAAEGDSVTARLFRNLGQSHIPGLDGMRAIAVFLVIFYHFGFAWVPGGNGVTMFFVISGLLITWLLLLENEKRGKISLAAFYRRRVFRIFPAFYCYWVLLIGLLLIAHKFIVWPQAISSLFYLTNYYNALHGDPNTDLSHTWSLAIEEQFYLLWPMIFIALRHDLRKMSIFLACLIAAVSLYRWLLFFVFHVNQGYFYAAFDTRMDSLMVGCLLAVLLRRRVLLPLWSAICSSGLFPLATVLLFAVSTYFASTVPRYRDVVGFTIDPLLIGIFIVQMIYFSSDSIGQWLEWRWVRFLGKISYSLYLYQQLTLSVVDKRIANLPLPLQVLIAVGVTIAVASLSYYLIEQPFLKLKTKRARAD